MQHKTHKAVDVRVVPLLDFSCLPGGSAPRRREAQQAQAAGVAEQATVAAPAEASPEAPIHTQPQSKPAEAAIACLGPLAMLPPKPAAMRREFIFA